MSASEAGLPEALLGALPLFAWVSGGYAMLTTPAGRVLRLVDRYGREYRELEGSELAGFSCEPEEGPAGIPCPLDKDLTMWAVPLGDVVLCLGDNSRQQEVYGQIREVLQAALPSIARVAGGEAVLFDRDGLRLHSVDSRGALNYEYMGQVSSLAKECMSAQKTLVGDSTYIVGAKAVRIPVCSSFGIGFNNNDTVAQRQKLLEGLYQNRNAAAEFTDIAGETERMRRLKAQALELAQADMNLLICGEKGSGRKMLAQAMHNASPRCKGPFVTVNCDSLEQGLLEGVLFGYADATFTGVKRGSNLGAIATAAGGTLVLNRVDLLEAGLQHKLAGALAGSCFAPVGNEDECCRVQARVMATAGRGLSEMAADGRFDPQLYGLLCGGRLDTPALSEIPEDIPVLARAFVEQLNCRCGMDVQHIDEEAMECLMAQGWRGNAAELFAVLQSAFQYMGDASILKKYNLPLGLMHFSARREEGEAAPAEGAPIERMLEEYEAQIIKDTLLKNKGSRKDTAEQLGISKPSLWRKMKKLQIE